VFLILVRKVQVFSDRRTGNTGYPESPVLPKMKEFRLQRVFARLTGTDYRSITDLELFKVKHSKQQTG